MVSDHQTGGKQSSGSVLVPKPNNKWCPILDLSKRSLFPKLETFKMETPETTGGAADIL